jgi:hypothetical protein
VYWVGQRVLGAGFEPPAVPVLDCADTGCSSSGRLLSSDNHFTSVLIAHLKQNFSGDHVSSHERLVALRREYDLNLLASRVARRLHAQ